MTESQSDISDHTRESCLLYEGDSFFVDEEYVKAIDAYGTYLNKMKSSGTISDNSVRAKAISHRSAAYLRLNRYTEALNDAKEGIKLLENILSSKNKNKIHLRHLEQCYRRKGMSCFYLKQMSEAHVSFTKALEIGIQNESKFQTEYRSFIEKSKEQSQTKSNNSSSNEPKSLKKLAPKMPKYQYYQNDTFMTISILEPNLTAETLKVDFSLDKLTVIVIKQSVSLTLICGTLFDAVDVSKCKIKYMDEKVLIKLRKMNKFEWHDLFGNGARDTAATSETNEVSTNNDNDQLLEQFNKSSIPKLASNSAKARPYSSTRDWDAIDRNIQKQEEQEKPVGDEAMNKLFKQIYGKANNDTKRAMIKSFQTSGGTVLSTNWDEVSQKDYEKERQAPKGMEWKNWEGNRLEQKDS